MVDSPATDLNAADIVPSVDHDFQYASCYCEENVWMLCERLCKTGRAHDRELHVVFISNPEQQVVRHGVLRS